MMKNLLGLSTKKNYKRKIKQSSELKKTSTEKMIKCSSNGKVVRTHLIVGLMKKILLYKMSYFPEPYNCR